jgi:hypothetical protein
LRYGDLSRFEEKNTMKVTRLILVCTLLLLAASPIFARPQCKECVNNVCVYTGNSVEHCVVIGGMCDYDPRTACSPFSPEKTVMTDWTVASIEIIRPEPAKAVTTAPAEVPAAETAARK